MSDRMTDLELTLAEVCLAATQQLRGMGRGKEPSPRLQAALDEAERLLGRNLTQPEQTALERELAELRERAKQ